MERIEREGDERRANQLQGHLAGAARQEREGRAEARYYARMAALGREHVV